MKKWLFIFISVLALLFVLIILFSPYGNDKKFTYKLVKHSVTINAPVIKVFNFLGNSKNASRWSVFVNHITTLNPEKFPDGKPGSIRRCFCKQDETGMQWDELITENITNKKRQLVIFNLVNFPVAAHNLATEQLYDSLSVNKCRLTFTVFFKDENSTLIERIKLYVVAYKIENILTRNMANIKTITENE